MIDLVLASSSPRRAELLRQIGLSFRIEPQSVVEELQPGEIPTEFVGRLSRQKAEAALASSTIVSETVVVGADTVVVMDGEVLGKPQSKDDAINMLMKLSGLKHRVATGVTIGRGDHMETQVVETIVAFRELTMGECEKYWLTGEPGDKAGAYGIQGLGAIFVASVEGSYSSVVGLPLMETANGLRHYGIDCLSAAEKNFE